MFLLSQEENVEITQQRESPLASFLSNSLTDIQSLLNSFTERNHKRSHHNTFWAPIGQLHRTHSDDYFSENFFTFSYYVRHNEV